MNVIKYVSVCVCYECGRNSEVITKKKNIYYKNSSFYSPMIVSLCCSDLDHVGIVCGTVRATRKLIANGNFNGQEIFVRLRAINFYDDFYLNLFSKNWHFLLLCVCKRERFAPKGESLRCERYIKVRC